MRTRTWQRISRSLSLIAATVLLVGCSATQMELSGAQSSRWPEAQQGVSTKVEAVPLPQSEPEVAAGEDDAVSVTALEGLCESVGRPALTTYLSAMPQDDWVSVMEECAFPGAIDLMKRPMVDELEWIAQMPGDTSEQVWCEAKTSRNIWPIGISWPDGQPGIDTIQPSDHTRTY